MKILVTGGAGFIGSNFIHYLIKKYPGYEIINLDRLAYSGNLENLTDIADLPMYHFVQGDICNEVEVDALLSQGIDAIVHLASEPYPNPEEPDPSRFIRTDMYGTYVLCEAAAAYKIDRFIHVSTAIGYGPAVVDDAQQRPAYEGDILRPGTATTASRVGSEMLVTSYTISRNLPAVILRPSSVYGPHQYPDQTMANWITSMISSESVSLGQTGRAEHDWIYIHDVCTALDTLLHARSKEVEGQVFNAGSGHARSEVAILDLLTHFLDRPKELVNITEEHTPSEQAVDTTKLERLGWKAETDFHKGLTETINWYQQHPDWWKELRQRMPELLDPIITSD